MAKIIISKDTTVAGLKQKFRDQVGATLRVFDGSKKADDNDKLVDLGAKVGEMEFRTSRTVGKFVQAMNDELNVKVKVRTADDWVTVLDGLTLATVKELPKQTTKAVMEDFIGYQHAENEKSESDKTCVQPEIKEKKDKEEKVESKHPVSLELAGYYNEVEYYVIPKDKQQQVLDFINLNDNEEIGDALSDLCNSGTINLDGCTIELEKAAIYSFSPDAMIVRVEGDESEYPSEELHAYDFWNVDNNGNPMVSVPENCPAWLSEGYIKPLQKLVSQLSKNDDASDVLNSLDSEKSWADLTMPNIPKGMKIGILKSAKGVWSCNIELNDNEKFDFYKLESLFYSQNIEPTGIGELDAFPLTGIIYDNKYYDLEEEDCRYQDQKMWMVDSDEEQIWPCEEDEDYDDEDY